jgi:Spy/CpxP family protein refolding chaperone
MNNSLRWKLVVAFVLVFLAGATTGFFGAAHFGHALFFRHAAAGSIANHLKKHLRAELKLTPQQVEKISPIVDQASRQLEAKREETGRQVRAIFEQMHASISPILTPEQRELLDQMEQKHRQMVRRHGFPPPPPPD